VACTGFALLAFLGYGESEKVGLHKENVRRAVAWLKSKQEANGAIVDPTDDGAHHRKGGYPIAISTMALVEAAGMSNIQETRQAAQRCVNSCVDIHQQGDGYERLGWRYAPKTDGDLSVSGWFIFALKSAKIAGLHVEASAFDGMRKFLEAVEVREAGTDNGYGPVVRYKYMPNAEHANAAHRLTAIGALARLFMGARPEELHGSVEWFLSKGGYPAWGGNGEKVDLYYWYYASMTTFQEDPEIFKKWSVALMDALIPNQRRENDEKGSWDPVGDYSSEWGRVGQTALSALCLEVYYRDVRVNRR
jgi:hypothetical protein